MPAPLSEVLAEADRLLEPERFRDYCVNGLQVPGPPTVSRIATAVSAHAELFALAAEQGTDLLLVHHGIFWGPGFRQVDEQLKRRLTLLFESNVALAAYHLPLDAHPHIGNNALLAKALGATRTKPFALHDGHPIGCIATLPAKTSASALFEQARVVTRRDPLVFDAGPATVERLAIVSGAGADYLRDAHEAGAQALLTGEAPERAMADARELGMHLIAAGHYATETLGITALGEHLAGMFDLEHRFLDVPNPI